MAGGDQDYKTGMVVGRIALAQTLPQPFVQTDWYGEWKQEAEKSKKLRHHLLELAKYADKAAMVLATLEAEDTTEEEMLQEIIDGISRLAPDALMGPNGEVRGASVTAQPACEASASTVVLGAGCPGKD